MTLDLTRVRAAFPALQSDTVFFDNPGGTQVPRQTLDRMNAYLLETNANTGGVFATSRRSDALLESCRTRLADFLNANSPEEIVFGHNMTTLTMALSRSLGEELKAGDEIVVTRLDHDANIAPWLQIAEAHGCEVRWIDFDVEDCTLRLEEMDSILSERTRLVAVAYASNAVGTINPLPRIIHAAHRVGALCFVDAVHYAPHGPIDVQALDCDFLVVSAYKFFGPHIGALYGKRALLEHLNVPKIRPAPDELPYRFETGTQNHEGIAGTLGALEYLEQVGLEFGAQHSERHAPDFSGSRLALKQAMTAIRAYEMELSRALIENLSAVPGLHIYGISEASRLDRRVPTIAFRVEGHAPRAVAQALDRARIYAWDGNFYALAVTERLDVEETGGLVRIGLVHYNTHAEIDRLAQALQDLVKA